MCDEGDRLIGCIFRPLMTEKSSFCACLFLNKYFTGGIITFLN